jgi:hypothetical protein
MDERWRTEAEFRSRQLLTSSTSDTTTDDAESSPHDNKSKATQLDDYFDGGKGLVIVICVI